MEEVADDGLGEAAREARLDLEQPAEPAAKGVDVRLGRARVEHDRLDVAIAPRLLEVRQHVHARPEAAAHHVDDGGLVGLLQLLRDVGSALCGDDRRNKLRHLAQHRQHVEAVIAVYCLVL